MYTDEDRRRELKCYVTKGGSNGGNVKKIKDMKNKEQSDTRPYP